MPARNADARGNSATIPLTCGFSVPKRRRAGEADRAEVGGARSAVATFGTRTEFQDVCAVGAQTSAHSPVLPPVG